MYKLAYSTTLSWQIICSLNRSSMMLFAGMSDVYTQRHALRNDCTFPTCLIINCTNGQNQLQAIFMQALVAKG